MWSVMLWQFYELGSIGLKEKSSVPTWPKRISSRGGTDFGS